MVCTVDKSGPGGPSPLRREIRVFNCWCESSVPRTRSLIISGTQSSRQFDVNESNPTTSNGVPVDVGLISGDVDTLDLSLNFEVAGNVRTAAKNSGREEEERRRDRFESEQHCWGDISLQSAPLTFISRGTGRLVYQPGRGADQELVPLFVLHVPFIQQRSGHSPGRLVPRNVELLGGQSSM